MPNISDITLKHNQTKIFQDKARFRVIVCGRRFSKTITSLVCVLTEIFNNPNDTLNCGYFAPFRVDAKKIAWKELKQLLQDFNDYCTFNESDLSVTFWNGSTLSLFGLDRALNRGAKYHFLILDECAFADYDSWTEKLRPSISDTQGKVIFITTPNGRNWVYDYYLKGLDPKEPDWSSYQFTSIDGGYIPEQEIESARRELPERTFRQEYLATFEEAQGRIVYAFSMKDNIYTNNIILDDNEPLWVGIDFNVNPMSSVICVFRAGVIYQFDEIVIENSNTTEICHEILNKYPNRIINFCPDPAGRARKTSANGSTDFTIIESFENFYIHAPSSHQAVQDRHTETNACFTNALGEHYYYITPNCKETIKALNGHCYKKGTSTPNKNDGFDHIVDSVGYLIHQLKPLKSTVDTGVYNNLSVF